LYIVGDCVAPPELVVVPPELVVVPPELVVAPPLACIPALPGALMEPPDSQPRPSQPVPFPALESSEQAMSPQLVTTIVTPTVAVMS
jgi:hypothetical protein